MNNTNFFIRRMNRDEIDLAIDWTRTEGWNPGNHDAECFYAADPDGFLLGLFNNEPVAMVSAVRYEQTYGFMGFYIVNPKFRNKGYGSQLWEAGLKYLENRNVGLDSVRPDLVSHRKPEFKPAYINFRFKWIKHQQFGLNPEIVRLADIPWNIVTAYDYEVFSFKRDNFLKCWITRPNAQALGVMNGDKLSAYGVIRDCREGFKIGPLFADNKDLAQSIFNALTRDLRIGVPVFLDTPAKNTDSVALAKDYGMTEVFRTTRMYNRAEPPLPLQKWFGVTSFELG